MRKVIPIFLMLTVSFYGFSFAAIGMNEEVLHSSTPHVHQSNSTVTPPSTLGAQAFDSAPAILSHASIGSGLEVSAHTKAVKERVLNSLPSESDKPFNHLSVASQPSASASVSSAARSSSTGLDSVTESNLFASGSARPLAPSFSGAYDYWWHCFCCECCIDESVMGGRFFEALISQGNSSYPCCLCCNKNCCYRNNPKPSQRGGSISLKHDTMFRVEG